MVRLGSRVPPPPGRPSLPVKQACHRAEAMLAGGRAALCWASRLLTQSAVFWPLEELGGWTAGLGDLGAHGQEGMSGHVNNRSGGKAAGACRDEQIPTGKAPFGWLGADTPGQGLCPQGSRGRRGMLQDEREARRAVQAPFRLSPGPVQPVPSISSFCPWLPWPLPPLGKPDITPNSHAHLQNPSSSHSLKARNRKEKINKSQSKGASMEESKPQVSWRPTLQVSLGTLHLARFGNQ